MIDNQELEIRDWRLLANHKSPISNLLQKISLGGGGVVAALGLAVGAAAGADGATGSGRGGG